MSTTTPLPPVEARIGFIGLGAMGTAMAHRLLAAGVRLTVWTRDPTKRGTARTAGYRVADCPAALAESADIVCLSLASEAAVEDVFGEDAGLGAAALADKVIVDTSTISPETTLRLHHEAAGRGANWLDAPVSGGVPGARAGSLTIFVGGEAEPLDRARPMLRCLGSRITHVGGPGSGQRTKLLNQLIVAANVMAIAEAVALAKAAGPDAERLAEVLRGGFADSQPLQAFGPRMARGAFEPVQTAIGLLTKDLGYARTMAADLGLPLPLADRLAELYARVAESPNLSPECDVSALVTLFGKSPGAVAES